MLGVGVYVVWVLVWAARWVAGSRQGAPGQAALSCAACRAVTMEELTNDEEYTDILEDMKEECGRFGQVLQARRSGR